MIRMRHNHKQIMETSPLLHSTKKRAMKLSPKIKAKICELKELSVLHPGSVEEIGSQAWLMRLLVHINNEDVTLGDVQRWIQLHPWILEDQTRNNVPKPPKKTVKFNFQRIKPKASAGLKAKQSSNPESHSGSGPSSPGVQADDFPPSSSNSAHSSNEHTDDDDKVENEAYESMDQGASEYAEVENIENESVQGNYLLLDSQTNSTPQNQGNFHDVSLPQMMQTQTQPLTEANIPKIIISSEPGSGSDPATQSRYTIIFESISTPASQNTPEAVSDTSAQFSSAYLSGLALGYGSTVPQHTSTSTSAPRSSGSNVYRPIPIAPNPRQQLEPQLAQQQQFLPSGNPRFNMIPTSMYAGMVQNSNGIGQQLTPAILPKYGWTFQDANMLHNIVAHLDVLSVYLRALPNALEPIQKMSDLMQSLIQYNRNQYYRTAL